jgi:hypothetical protein
VATLAQLRAKLNGEIGVTSDGDTVPWTTTVRNTAIGDGYADLWRQGVWKPLRQDITADSDLFVYTLTSIRRVGRVEVLDSSGAYNGRAIGRAEDDGAGALQLVLPTPVATGYTIRVYGWTAYKSVFSSDSDTDDLAAEYNRIPLLKAKAILYRQQLGQFARYGERQAVPAEMNLTIDQFLGIIAAAEREYIDACRDLANQRPRIGRSRRSR